MKAIYQAKIDTMMNNYEMIKKEFSSEGDLSKHFLALNYAIRNKALDVEVLKDLKKYLKSSTGLFSPFRSQMSFALCGLLDSSFDDPKKHLDQMISNLEIMKQNGFKNTSYLPMALFALSTAYEGENPSSLLKKAHGIYLDMRNNHPFLTSGDDYALAVLLASADRDPHILEMYYKALVESGFPKSNGLQMLSHILAFSEKSLQETVDRCKGIYDALKEAKLKVTTTYYPAIGLVCLLDDQCVNDLIEVADSLRNIKKYRNLGKGMNILMASAIVTSAYESDDVLTSTALQVSVQTIIAAQQAAMIAAVSGAAVATSS